MLQLLFLISTATAICACDKHSPSTATTHPTAQPNSSIPAKAPNLKPKPPLDRPTPAQVESIVIEIISAQTGVRKSEITPEIDLKKDLKIDELDLVELVMEIEDDFNLKISDESSDSWHTVGQVIEYVRMHYKP